MAFNQTIRCLVMQALAATVAAGSAAFGQIPNGHFTDIMPLLADPRYTDFAPSVTEDGLTMVFTNLADSGFPARPETSGYGDLYMATRTTTEEPFSNVINLGAPVNSSTPEVTGHLSPDGEILYFDTKRIPSQYDEWDIFQATRGEDGTYVNAVPLAGINTERTEYMPSISSDGRTLYYASRPDHGVGQRRLWSASRDTMELPFGNAHDLGDAINGDPPIGDDQVSPDRGWPSISADERFLFFHIQDGPRGIWDTWVSYRETVNSSFGSPQSINELWPGTEINTSGGEGWASISRDWPAPGSKIYFAADRLGVNRLDIFQATWQVPEPSTLLLSVVCLSVIAFWRRGRVVACVAVVLATVHCASAHADIYQWEYVDPLDPSQGKQPSTTLAPDGEGLTPRSSMNAGDKDLTQAYLAGFDLSHAEFSGATLTDGYLAGSNLTSAGFYYAMLANADLSSANLTLASFYEATVAGVDFTNAEIRRATFYNSIGFTAAQLYSTSSYQEKDLTSTSFFGLDVAGWNFVGQNLTDVNFLGAMMTGTELSDTNLSDAWFRHATLTAANFNNAVIRGADFRGANGLTPTQFYSTASYQAGDLAGIGLARVNLTSWDFAGLNLVGAEFGGATLTGAKLSGANLTDADFSKFWFEEEPTTLSGADFTNAVIRGADFGDTKITSTQLYSTASYQAGDLAGVDLSENDLTDWNFAGQDLTGAGLSGALLGGADFTNALVAGVEFGRASENGFRAEQLYSTASYQERDLAGVRFFELDLTRGDLSGQNLTGADFTHATLTGADLSGTNLTDARLVGATLTDVDLSGAEIRGADLWVGGPGTGVTAAQVYSTASYQVRDLTGVSLASNDLTGWDFTDVEVRGADFSSTAITAAQLYSTASYQAGDLTAIGLSGNDLTSWDFAEKVLINANFGGVTLINADLSDADLRGAHFTGTLEYANLSGANLAGTSYFFPFVSANLNNADLTSADARGASVHGLDVTSAQTRNFIHPDGRVEGLHIAAGELMRLWDFDLTTVRSFYSGDFFGDIQIDIFIEDSLWIDATGTLRAVFEDGPWGSMITFESGIPVSLGGTLELLFDNDVNPLSLVGTTYQLFDWTRVTPTGAFDSILFQPGTTWDTSSLYTTGEVTLVGAVPEPSTLLLCGLTIGFVIVALWHADLVRIG